LLRFGYTRDEYRSQFRNIKTKSSENTRELATRCEQYLSHWLYDSDIISQDCRKINESLIIEQIYQCLPTDLVVWLKDRSPTSVTQIIDLVEIHKQSRNLSNHAVLHGSRTGSRDTPSVKPNIASSSTDKKTAVVPVVALNTPQAKGKGHKGQNRNRFLIKMSPGKHQGYDRQSS
jgi:hypothetical protein